VLNWGFREFYAVKRDCQMEFLANITGEFFMADDGDKLQIRGKKKKKRIPPKVLMLPPPLYHPRFLRQTCQRRT
jgi:hypothetical protein